MAVDNSRLHREAQQSAALRAAILAQITDGLAIADASGKISFINAAGRQILVFQAPPVTLTPKYRKPGAAKESCVR
jgi:sensor histidine kinase regulating citrate/malate metabolism